MARNDATGKDELGRIESKKYIYKTLHSVGSFGCLYARNVQITTLQSLFVCAHTMIRNLSHHPYSSAIKTNSLLPRWNPLLGVMIRRALPRREGGAHRQGQRMGRTLLGCVVNE